jgi:X-X-X-Leu-X-X-Gly heptad repeat protein
MTVGRYDTDAMRGQAQYLRSASDTLRELAADLVKLVDATVPRPVSGALSHLVQRGKDMTGDLADGATALASGLETAAKCYDDLDQSLVRGLSST